MAKKKIESLSMEEIVNTDEEALFDHAEVETEPKDDSEPEPQDPVEDPKPVIENVTVNVEPPKPEENPAALAYQIRELKRERDEERAKREQLENARKAEPTQVEDPEPDAQIDPIGHILWENRQIKAQLSEVNKWRTETVQQTEEQRRELSRVQGMQQAEEEYRKAQPDYDNAAEVLWQNITRSAKMFAPQATPEQINKFCLGQILDWSDQAKEQGKNPAQAMYEMAKSVGYAPQLKEEPAPSRKPNLEVIDKNRRRSANGLSSGSGGKNTLTASDIAKMSTGELAKLSDEELDNILAG